MKGRIAVLGGDGIGPEVVAEGVRVLEAVASRHGHVFELEALPFGGVAIDAFGDGLPEHTLEGCVAADGVLLGAIGGPKWGPDAPVRPEPALLRLRAELGVYANLRPIAVQQALRDASPIKPEYLDGVDLLFVRELTGGIYFGRKWREGERAFDECAYSVSEIERITRVAGRLAASRRGKITQVDKSNVLETSRLWRTVSERVIRTEFPGVKIEHMFVDAAAMHLIRRPRDFDVILTENLFGDILTDEGAMLAGSLGVLPSAALGEGRRGLYEPIHGSAPDIAGLGIANPCGTILSAALLLRHSLGLESEARAIEAAVAKALSRGARTADIAANGAKSLSTREMGDAVLAALD
ncbi:MAG: 3-isopropylmalate dehydrogenase [Gammaproteobacteria bacterium]|nr:3-isopropylmalate dehydrogenase [Gammaproteobacteria bacterium]NCW21416.1 3-isopropylmalate dehydrogenase [Gammaproteobacteria bacterium]NDB17465.1 3-isopropylmalate dehydrogenase [Gammaproteobacteria bacterium]